MTQIFSDSIENAQKWKLHQWDPHNHGPQVRKKSFGPQIWYFWNKSLWKSNLMGQLSMNRVSKSVWDSWIQIWQKSSNVWKLLLFVSWKYFHTWLYYGDYDKTYWAFVRSRTANRTQWNCKEVINIERDPWLSLPVKT